MNTMGKMSQLHADTAPERADSAESDLSFAKDTMRETATKLEELRTHLLDSHALITLDALDCLEELANDLRLAAGKPAEETAADAATASAVADAIEDDGMGYEF